MSDTQCLFCGQELWDVEDLKRQSHAGCLSKRERVSLQTSQSHSKNQEIAALKARVAELEKNNKWHETASIRWMERLQAVALAANPKWDPDNFPSYELLNATIKQAREERDKLAAQVEKLRAFAQNVDKIRGASADQILTIELRHGLRIESEDQNCRKTPLLTGEPSDH